MLKQTSPRLEGRVAEEDGVAPEYPLFYRMGHGQTAAVLTDTILTQRPYPIKALMIQGCNPILTWPNTNKVKKAFEKLELLVVIDLFMTDTAKVADIVLPGTTFLERKDLRDYSNLGLPLIMMSDKVIEPLGNCMEDWKIWSELAKRMGYAEYFPWEDVEQLFEYFLGRTNITTDQLRQNPGGVFHAEREFEKYLRQGFDTPSGKVEIYSETMEKLGYDALPTFHEPLESPVSKPDLARRYPLILTTGARVQAFTHSQYRNVPILREYVPEPLVEINTETAVGLGIADGDTVTIESARGSIKLKAKVTEDIFPKVVSVLHGWSEANGNMLTDDEGHDPVSAYPGFRSVLCRVIKSEKGEN